MATGAGKTFTAITSVYRLLKHTRVRRVLFLVDTRNLGEQAEQEFLAFTPSDASSATSARSVMSGFCARRASSQSRWPVSVRGLLPPRRRACVSPVVRCRFTHRIALATLTPKIAAAAWHERPDATVRITRSRKSFE